MPAMIFLILKRQRYFVLALSATLLMFALSYVLTLWNITGKSISAYVVMSGWSFTLISLFLSLAISILFGIYLSLLWARKQLVQERGEKNKLAGAGGLASGLLAAGCPTCGAPLFALLGAPLALFSLPFRGLELKVLSIVLLLLASYLLVENIKKQLVCRV